MIPKVCKFCGEKFGPSRPMQTVCNPLCASRLVRRDRKEKEKEAKQERIDHRERKERIKKISEIEAECREIVQKIARIRDRHDSCISCDLPADWDGQWHGSHYRSHGAASAVQFHLWNINKACWICNKLYSGRIDAYKVKLIEKIGQSRVDWLDSQNQVIKNSREYLARFKKVMGKRCRRLEKSSLL